MADIKRLALKKQLSFVTKNLREMQIIVDNIKQQLSNKELDIKELEDNCILLQTYQEQSNNLLEKINNLYIKRSK